MWVTVMTEWNKQRGLTIVEMVVAIVVLAISLVGITQMISGGITRTSDTLIETRAVALAQSYLDEILSRRFDQNSNPRGIPPCRPSLDPLTEEDIPPGEICTHPDEFGPEASELACAIPRICFNDVDDYHGLDEGLGQDGPLLDAEGQERVDYENFRVRVNVRYLLPCDDGPEAFMDVPQAVCDALTEEDEQALINAVQAAKLITVTVSHVTNPDGWAFSVYKANF